MQRLSVKFNNQEMFMRGIFASLMLMAAGVANAAGVIQLPDPAITVNPNYYGTTIVTVGGVVYRGPSTFAYFSPCAKANGPHYHCSIQVENGAVLYDAGGNNTITVDLTVQFASTLIISGHNWWRSTQTVLSGEIVIL